MGGFIGCLLVRLRQMKTMSNLDFSRFQEEEGNLGTGEEEKKILSTSHSDNDGVHQYEHLFCYCAGQKHQAE